METVKINVTSAEKASRLELFIRWIWGTIVAIILGIIGIFACIAMFIQWFYILILGRRSEDLSNVVKGYLEYLVHVMSYTYFMTDRRPDILPIAVRIFEEA